MMRNKGIMEVQVRGTVEGEDSVVEAQEEPLKLISELCSLELRDLAELEYIWKGPTQSVSLHRLESVTLRGCPKLRNIFTFAIVTSLPELRKLEINECEEWEGIFCEESLRNLSSSSNVCFPKLQNIGISRCNKVKRLFSYSLASHCPSLEELKISNRSELESLVDEEASHEDILQPHGNETKKAFLVVTAKSFKQLQNHEALTLFLRLKLVRIESSGRRKKGMLEVQVRGTIVGEYSVVEAQEEPLKLISELCSLYLYSLEELEYIWKGPSQSVSLHRLEEVILVMCPKLRNIFTFAIVTSLPELRRLYVYECEEWEGIFCEESLKYLASSASSNGCFPKLQSIEIRKCNKMKRLLSYSLASHCPSLEKLDIEDCFQFEDILQPHGNETERAFFVVNAKSFKQLQNHEALTLFLRLKHVQISRSGRRKKGMLEVQVRGIVEGEGFVVEAEEEPLKLISELCVLKLTDLAEFEYIWKGLTQSVSLHRLERVTLQGCPKLRNVFTSAIVTSLPELRGIHVYGCVEWEGILCKESVKYLSSSSSNVCFPKLQNIKISGGNKMTRLFSYSLASNCPSLEELEIRDCSELESLVDEQASHGDILQPHENETERAFLVVTAKSFKQLQNREALTLFLRLKLVTIENSGRRKKGMFEVQVRGTVEGEDSVVEAQEEPLKLISELCSLELSWLEELEYIWKGPTQSVSLHRLESVTLRGCPKLRNVFTFAIVTSLPELRRIYVYRCVEWEGILCEESVKYLSSSSSSNVCFPKLQSIEIRECNKVKRLFSYSLASHCPSLEKLYIWDCSALESLVDEEASYEDILQPHGNETERAFLVVTAKSFKQLQNHDALTLFLRLKLVRIESSGRRKKGIFEVQVTGTVEGEHSVEAQEEPLKLISELCSLQLNSLAELEYIWKGPTHFMSLHRLENVKLAKCAKLRNIFTLAIITSLPELRSINVFDCKEWEGILCEESVKYLSSSNVCFPKLQSIVIRKCNKVKRLFSYSVASHCSSLEELHIGDCSELESLVDEASDEDILQLLLKLKTLTLATLPKLSEIFGGRFEHKLESLHNKQECSPHKQKNERVKVVNLEVISIRLERLPKWEYIWKGPTHFVSLHRLEKFELVKCRKLRNIFTLTIVTSLPELKSINVSDCQEWEGIFCEESLKNLSSSTVCFPKLERIGIFDCHKVRRLFSYSLASHCPSLEKITIEDCSDLRGVVQAYEGEVAGHHEKLFPKLNGLNLNRLLNLREIYPGYSFNHFSDTRHIEYCPRLPKHMRHPITIQDII